jgi:type II secretory pathway pseudopilin PulG
MSVFETFRNIGASEYRCGRVHADTRPHRHIHTFRSGFSLTEILIVIGLIVLMLALAVPTFNFLTGNRSVEGAQNTIGALIGRARVEAIGLQETRGVFFFIDRASGRVAAALVRAVERPDPATFLADSNTDPSFPPEVWLDLVPDNDLITLPAGVMLQTVDEALVNASGIRIEDAYLGYNRRNEGNQRNQGPPQSDTHTLYGGVILFDGSGQLVAQRYAFKTFYVDAGGNRQPTRMGDLLYRPKGDPSPYNDHYRTLGDVNDVVPLGHPPQNTLPNWYFPKSQLGVVLFDRERWMIGSPAVSGQNYEKELDWQFQPLTQQDYSESPSTEHLEENWIDENGLPLMINRYNGTLVRAQ